MPHTPIPGPYVPPPDTVDTIIHVTCAYDTLFPLPTVRTTPRKSLFTGHQLQVLHSAETTIQRNEAPGWFLGFIALSFLFICIYLRSKQLNLGNVVNAAVNNRAMERILRESNLTHTKDLTIIAPIMLLPLTLIGCYFFVSGRSNTWFAILQYLTVYVGACLVYYLRNGIIRLIGNAFENDEAIHIYLSSNYIYHLLYAVAATPMAFFVCYTDNMGPVFLQVLGGIIGLLFIMRLLRGMQLILTHAKSSKLYLFYYLCTLEIVPVLLVIKAAISL